MASNRQAYYFLSFFSVGLINNIGYVVISTGAQVLAAQFGQENLMPLVQLMLVSFNIASYIVNIRYLIGIKYIVRVTCCLSAMAVSFSVMALCSAQTQIWGFAVALLAALLMGLCQAWGEGIMLGFTKAFPSETVVGFSAGTGFAGVLGTSLWIGLSAAEVPIWGIYTFFIPSVLIYYFSFRWLNKQVVGSKQVAIPLTEESLQQHINPTLNEQTSIISESNNISADSGNAFFSIKQLKITFKIVWFWSLCLGSVYYLEYVIITGFADRATLKQKGSGFIGTHAYEILLFCYQFGVLMSRSSLKLFKVRKVWIVSVLQAVNFAIWWGEAMSPFLSHYGEFALMIWVGCLGGLSYVNVAYLILQSEELPKEYKETGMNIILSVDNVFVILSCLTCLLLDNTLMKD